MLTNESKILLTGGAGFVGSHICEYAIKKGIEVVIVDVFNSETSNQEEKVANVDHLKEAAKKSGLNLKIYPCSITDQEALTKIFVDESPSLVIHAASLVKDRYSMDVPLDFIDTNVKGSQVLLDSSNAVKTIEQFIFISSRSAIGEVPGASAFMKEDNHFRPINPYGATKAAAEGLFHSFHHNTKIPVKICRMQPMYGPRCRSDMFVWRILHSILTGDKIQKYGTGEGVRDWLFIKDAVEAIFKIILYKSPFDIFNIGTGKGTSTNMLIELCQEITGKEANIEDVEVPPGDTHFAGLADCRKIKDKIGWESQVDIKSGIELTYEYMKKHYSES